MTGIGDVRDDLAELPTVLDGPLRSVAMGPKLAALDRRRQIFAWCFGTGIASSAKEAARMAGFSDPALSSSGKPSNSLGARASTLLHEPAVIEAIEEVAQREFRTLVPLVISSAKQLLLDPKHQHHAKTVLSLLGRLGFAERTAVDVNVAVAVDHTAEAVEQLRILKGMGVSRDKLLETFGHSGLGIYEAKLRELDGNQPKLIEGTAVDVTGAVSETAATIHSAPRQDVGGE